jgi:hypothetical protein
MTSANQPDPPGPLGEEAAKLIAAAQEWFHRTLGDSTTSKIATGTAECSWCPVCQLIGALRGERPELTEKLADTQAAVAGLLRALADAANAGVHQHRAGEPNHPNHGRVQKIDLDGG